MKKLTSVILKNGDCLLTNSSVQNCTFYDLQTRGKKARQCILRTLKKECINYKEVKTLIFQDFNEYPQEIEMYSNTITQDEIKEIYNNLKAGYCYSDKDNFKGFYKHYDSRAGHDIIRYNNYGSSAVKFNLANLKWLLKVIFEDDFYKLTPKRDGVIYY